MGKICTVSKSRGTRIAFFALLIMTMVTATLHMGAQTAQAAQATVTWSPPTTNTNGTALTDLAGYKVYYGTSSGNYTQKIDVGNVTSYTVVNLNSGTTYYFAMTAYDTSGLESAYSPEVSKPIPAVTTYSITATAGAGGTITALNNNNVSTATNTTSTITTATVTSGANQSFSITPSTGYKVQSVTVDGTSVGAVTTYTFSNVTANHTISATFAAANYTINASAGTGGSISPSGSVSVISGGSQTFAIAAANGYSISSVTVDGTSVGAVTSYTFSNVTANHTISATFAAMPKYTITASAGTGGSISPSGSVSVISGGSQTFAIAAASGYTVSSVTVDGTSLGAITSYSFSNVTANHTISATFAVANYTITASAGTGGSISPSGSVSVTSGGSQTFTIAAASGYKVSSVTVDGASVGAVTSYTFSNVVANHTIQATFASSGSTTGSTSIFATNSGGAQYVSSTSGITYLADTKYNGGSVGSTTAAIGGTSDGALYQTERWGNFSYSIPATNGNYNVTLKFAEIYWSASGKRVFNVAINGQTVISNLDIYSKAGKNVAYDVVIPVSVTNGAINITFTSVVDYAKVSAINVAPAASVVAFATNGGGAQYLSSSTGTTYLADTKYSGGSVASTTATIGGTSDGTLYQTERWGNFSYSIPVPNGNYNVTLKFAEIYWSAAGKRVFSVAMNGQTVISNLDIYSKVGKNVAYDVVVPVTVTNGVINLNFTSQVDYAKISAILIKSI